MSKLQNIISADYNRQELNFKEQNLQTPCLIRLEKQSKLPTATVGSAMGGGGQPRRACPEPALA